MTDDPAPRSVEALATADDHADDEGAVSGPSHRLGDGF